MNKKINTLHSIYMIVSPIIIIVLLILTIVYWKQKKDCKTKEGLCLCNGPQIQSECRPYNFNNEMGINVNSPRIGGPSELRMKYDRRWTGFPPNIILPWQKGGC
jgi:hypothetical protein